MPFIWTDDETKTEFAGNSMTWDELIEYGCAQLEFQNRTPHHIYDVRRALINASAWFVQANLQPVAVNVRNATNYLVACGQDHAPITVRQRAIKLKWLFRLAYRHELLEKNRLENLIVPSVPSRKTKVPTLDEIQRIINAMNTAWTEEQRSGRFKSAGARKFFLARDPLMVYILAECGLRIGELVKLVMEDVNMEERTLTLRNTKNGSDRCMSRTYFTVEPMTSFTLQSVLSGSDWTPLGVVHADIVSSVDVAEYQLYITARTCAPPVFGKRATLE